jgi:hypothetical protein
VVLLMIWLPDGLLSHPRPLRAKRRQKRVDSAARTAAAQAARPRKSGAGAMRARNHVLKVSPA